jgi:hypothetical protein
MNENWHKPDELPPDSGYMDCCSIYVIVAFGYKNTMGMILGPIGYGIGYTDQRRGNFLWYVDPVHSHIHKQDIVEILAWTEIPEYKI